MILTLEEFKHRGFGRLMEYLDAVSTETPHQYYGEGERMSEVRSKFDKAVTTLERAMQGCSKMIVYLEQAAGLSHNADGGVLEGLSDKYMLARGKMLRLERSWQKFRATTA